MKEPNANEIAMLLANMAKSDSIECLITLKRDMPLGLSTSNIAIDQLMDCFVKGAQERWNPKASLDYLAYLFADLAKVVARLSVKCINKLMEFSLDFSLYTHHN